MSAETYDVLPMPTHIGNIFDKHNNVLKPFVAAYFPEEILKQIGWTKKDNLKLSIEKGFLKIYKSDAEPDSDYFAVTNELTYEPLEDEI